MHRGQSHDSVGSCLPHTWPCGASGGKETALCHRGITIDKDSHAIVQPHRHHLSILLFGSVGITCRSTLTWRFGKSMFVKWNITTKPSKGRIGLGHYSGRVVIIQQCFSLLETHDIGRVSPRIQLRVVRLSTKIASNTQEEGAKVQEFARPTACKVAAVLSTKCWT